MDLSTIPARNMVTILKSARSVPLKVTITPELHERLREVAAQLGQAPATVASLAIGQYVAQISRSLGAVDSMTSAIATQMGPEMQKQMKLLESVLTDHTPAKKRKRVTA